MQKFCQNLQEIKKCIIFAAFLIYYILLIYA